MINIIYASLKFIFLIEVKYYELFKIYFTINKDES